MKREHQDSKGPSSSSSSSSSASSMAASKAKNLWQEEQDAGGMDELLAVLGYKVRTSDMADVAFKLEQLEMVMGFAQDDNLSHLSDSVHYNPSDLSAWVQSMLSELNPLPDSVQSHQSSIFNDHSEYDLRAIPGVAAFPPPPPETETSSSKRLKTSEPSVANQPDPTRPLVLNDSQETGVRLVHTLLACAEAVQADNLKLAEALVKHIALLAASQASAMRKVATYFAEALARRIYKIYPQDCLDPSYSQTLEMHFYETCPYLKFAHFTANQAIRESFGSANRVHVIDFGLKQGMQWPALLQALALRPGGPPTFRLTGIGPPDGSSSGTDTLQQVGWKLAQLAQTIGVEFEFHPFVANSLADISPELLNLRPAEVETIAVNSIFELHRLLAPPFGIDKVLNTIKAMNPKIVTIVEQEANHNGPAFLDRFTEALHYYSSLFDSLEGSGLNVPSQDLVMSELYLGRQICNVVACEGADRFERHETLTHWRTRFESSGFRRVHLGSNAFKQASMLLDWFAGGDGYRVEENNGCLMLGWHTRPLIATSAWRLGG